jgi:aminoglycoside phosphotransferase
MTSDDIQWTNIPCSVRTLELHECLFDARGIKDILKRFHKLESLAICHGDACRSIESVRGSDMELGEMGICSGHAERVFVELSIYTEEHQWRNKRLGSL